MANLLKFELVSPEKLLLSEEASVVTVPGAEGEFGVLIDHIPTISSLQAGVIRSTKEGTITHQIFVGGGFVEVADGRCTILAEEAIPVSELDAESTNREIDHVNHVAGKSEDEHELNNCKSQLVVLNAKLQAIENYG